MSLVGISEPLCFGIETISVSESWGALIKSPSKEMPDNFTFDVSVIGGACVLTGSRRQGRQSGGRPAQASFQRHLKNNAVANMEPK